MNNVTDEINERKSVTITSIISKIKFQLKSIIFAIIICISLALVWLNLKFGTAKSLYIGAIGVYVVEIIVGILFTFCIFPFGFKIGKKKKKLRTKVRTLS
jgi:hypothetical protein